jgi:hypothetical protein
MSIKKFFFASAIAASSMLGSISPASAYGFDEWVKDNFASIRARTVSTFYQQTFIQDMSDSELQKYKNQYGDPGYIPYVDGWCSDQVIGHGYSNNASRIFGRNGMVGGIYATWRYENGKVNCYVRHS